ncbi:radical SAM protein [Dactylosporangium sp. NPDC051541]|uniref:radical SAM protein n=1 Tax=Dactylosporangium sp. NPDC051541 TaxID=3363977 RepID=UPI003790E45F
MHQLIAAPFLDEGHLILRPGSEQGMRIPAGHYDELRQAAEANGVVPDWLWSAARDGWSLDLAGRQLNDAVCVRNPGQFGYGRATWELNLGCNYDCEHCYLGLKRFEGMHWEQRVAVLNVLRDAGVVWLQMTGGEPLIDRLFVDSYHYAWDLGMMISISTNASRLWRPEILNLLRERPAYHITISVYGATADTYDALVRRRGAFATFHRGITAAAEAGLPMNFNLLATTTNDTEVDGMRALAEDLGVPYHVFSNMAPTIQGDANPLAVQSIPLIADRKPFTGCNAGHTFFHVDPHGKASLCKIGRKPNIDLLAEGVDGLRRLGGIADQLLTRQGGCTGCTVQGTCGTCMPLVQLYRQAKSPMERYCQHRETGEVIINGTRSSTATSADGGTRHDLATSAGTAC